MVMVAYMEDPPREQHALLSSTTGHDRSLLGDPACPKTGLFLQSKNRQTIDNTSISWLFRALGSNDWEGIRRMEIGSRLD